MKSGVLLVALHLLLPLCAQAQVTFASADIGTRIPAGQTLLTNGGFDISSATGDVWDTADDFRFVYQQVSGDFDIRARIANFTGLSFWAKAGLMVREDISDTAANGFMVATRSAGWGRYMFTGRVAKFYNSYVYSQGSFERVQYPHVWVRLARVGSLVIPMHSTNGFSWTQIGNLAIGQLPRTVLVGMAVSNHPESQSVRATAQFRDVALDAGTPVAPVIFSEPFSEVANPGADVTFSVTAVGRGSLSYQWFYNGTPIEGATNSAHLVRAVQETDEGKFTCRVRNEFGEVHSWAGLLEVEEAHRPFNGIRVERYSRVYGRRIEYMMNATNYPAAPFPSTPPPSFELPSQADDSAARLTGYVTAPATGEYTFYIAADDRGELWLSTDDNPANKRFIAESYYWVGPRQWDAYLSQRSDPIFLQAGRRYYLEALLKGEGIPNHGSVGWRLPSGVFERPIPPGRFLAQPALLQSLPRTAAGSFEFRITGTANSLYTLQTSTNLSEWTPFLTNRAPFNVTLDLATSDSGRFYRAVSSR